MWKKIRSIFFKTTPARLLVMGFASVIFLGAVLLWLPLSHNPGHSLSFFDALFEACSAVCVTGLTVVSPGDTFNLFGRFVLAALIQIGGMGVVLFGILVILVGRGRLDFKTRAMFVQAQNLSGYADVVRVAKIILRITFGIELGGAFVLWLLLMRWYAPLPALGHACFLAVSAFNNAGFDVFHGSASLIPYSGDAPFCLAVTALVILGSFGFIAMIDLFHRRFHWRRLLLTTKVSIFMMVVLLAGGTLLLKGMTSQTWLEAWTQSVVARTAGFSTYPASLFGQGALLVFIILMFIGASPNSTGGGIKTTTAFVIALKAFSSSAGHDEDSAFHRRLPEINFTKASTVLFFGLAAVLCATTLVCFFDRGVGLGEALFEVVSAVATVGSSCGITSSLSAGSKLVLIVSMFIGRVGAVTIANVLVTGGDKRAHYTEESVLIG